jgi:hypothetical protein
MTAKNKGGRPPKHGATMSVRATLMVKPEELESLNNFAKEKRWSVSTVLRVAMEKAFPGVLKAEDE